MIPTVTLPGTTKTTTALGFGCNALLGPRPRREGLAMLAAAYDAGIRHFDVARSYSSGDAEGLLGEFLGGRRDTLTVTTKFGMQPPGRGLGRLRWVKSIARALMKLSPGVRQAIGKRARRMTVQGAFTPDQARASLETSLRELKTDRVDLLLLHEAGPADCTPELRAFLEETTRAGLIGGFGVGSRFDLVREVARDRPEFARPLQFENSVTRRNRDRLDSPSPTITHGAIGGSFTHLRAYLAAHPESLRRWSESLGLDLSDPGTLAPLMLCQALRANPGGIVLFSSTRPASILANARAVSESRFPPDQLDRFTNLALEAVEP